jgi:16S rRNA (uracil1498-N3)-methyltransferase
MMGHLEEAGEKTSLYAILESNKSRLEEGIGIWIGPEGDFSQKEIAKMKQSGISAVSLGSSILRTETAAIYSASVIKALAENIEN